MSQYIVTRIDGHTVTEAWGPFQSPDAAAEWLGEYDARLLDFLWDMKGDHWFARVEDGDVATTRFQIRPLDEPAAT